jgi:uncharacterized iron-regulated protein
VGRSRLLLMVLLTLLLAGCAGRALRVGDRQVLLHEAMVEEVKGSRLVFVGEVHTDQGHHDLQLQVLRAMHDAGGEVAVALEMFSRRSQPHLDAWRDGALPEEAFAELYRLEWRNTPYELYAAIFRYARDRGIRLVGLNVPREIVQKVAGSGFSSLTEGELAQLPTGIRCDVTPEFRRTMQQVFTLFHGGERSLDNFCEAQMLRNSGMAMTLAEVMERDPALRVLVLVGGGHAVRQGGIPELLPPTLRRQSRVIIPAINGITADNVTAEHGDYLLLGGHSPLLDYLAGY